MDFQEKLSKYIDQEGLHRTEGEQGVKNLAKLVNALGYSDFINRYGQMAGGACLGDIFVFLEDNPGAIEALIGWIGCRKSPEWSAALVVEDQEPKAKDFYEGGVCPDCNDEIDPHAIRGEECGRCGHVFNWGPNDDADWNNSDGQGA